MSEQGHDLGKQVIEACLAMGFALAGIAPAAPTGRRGAYEAWLAAGKHGEMGYLAELLEERLDVTRFLPGARAVIVVADQYAARGVEEWGRGGVEGQEAGEARGVVAKYARGRDYHAVMKRRLHALCDRLREMHPGEAFRAFVDTAAVLEREHAVRAGLGFIGKHTLLISPRMGSYVLLGGVVTTVELGEGRPDATLSQTEKSAGFAPKAGLIPGVREEDHCGTCTLCIDACPTGAITPWSVDARRCVSYLTLEHRSVIDPGLHAGIADRLIGCDVCQDVCPFNRMHQGALASDERVHGAYADEGVRARLPVLEVARWTEVERTRVMGGSAGKRASLAMMRRNAVIVAGNALAEREDAGLRAEIERLARDAGEDAVVRETARQVLERLGQATAG